MATLDRNWLLEYSSLPIKMLAEISILTHCRLFICGGAVRDWLLGKVSNDLDVTVAGDALYFAKNMLKSF